MNTRQSTKYNEVVGILENGEVYVLDETFAYEGGLHGATHYTMNRLYEETVEEMNDLDYLKENYGYLWQDAVAGGKTDLGLEEYLEQCKRDAEAYGLYYMGDDDSFRYDMEEAVDKMTSDTRQLLKETLGVQGEDFLDWQCGSCGRVGNDMETVKWKYLFRPDLVEVIREAEK